MNIEKILRNVPTEEKVFRNQKRVSVIKAVDCILALSKYNMDTPAIKVELQKMLSSYKLVRVKASEKNPNNVDLALSKSLNANDMYMWAEEKSGYLNLLVALLFIALFFFLAMFQLWPYWLRSRVFYLKYVLGAIIGFFLAAGVIRFVVFSITYFTHPPGLWLIPNLFDEELGVRDSFKPLYSWANENVSHAKED